MSLRSLFGVCAIFLLALPVCAFALNRRALSLLNQTAMSSAHRRLASATARRRFSAEKAACRFQTGRIAQTATECRAAAAAK